MSSNLKINERLIANLKKYTDLSDTEVDEYAYFMVASDYFKLPDHRGGAVMPGNKHYRPDGTEFTIADVSYKHVLQGVESLIKDQPEDRRTEMYRNVVAGTNGAKKNPDWEREAVNPNAEPKTPFSASKADNVKSNQRLIDDLASALGMEERLKGIVQAQIVYRDALGDEKRAAGIMIGGDEGGTVHGGRLGRDHKLSDVPNHFVRDQIMDYLSQAEQYEEDKKQEARTAVFSDLSPSDISAYSALFSTTVEEELDEEYADDDHDRLEEIMKTHKPKPKSLLEAKNILQQEKLLDSIPDDTLDLTKRGTYGRLDMDFEGVFKSVVKPGSHKLDYEAEVKCPTTIDLDCDQVRACIERFTHGGIWSIDQFRLALGQVARPELTKFLEKRGPSEGATLRVRSLCWEFLKTREVLGLDMCKSSKDDIKMIEEKGKKRKNPASGDGNQSSGKKAKPPTDSSSEKESELIDLTED